MQSNIGLLDNEWKLRASEVIIKIVHWQSCFSCVNVGGNLIAASVAGWPASVGLVFWPARLIPAVSYFFPSFLLLCSSSSLTRSLCIYVYVHVCAMYTQTQTSHWQFMPFQKKQTKEFKKNRPTIKILWTKNEENKKTPRTLPEYPSSGFLALFFSLFMVHVVESVFSFSLWHEKKKKQEGNRCTGTSCRRVPSQYPVGWGYLRGESKFVPQDK